MSSTSQALGPNAPVPAVRPTVLVLPLYRRVSNFGASPFSAYRRALRPARAGVRGRSISVGPMTAPRTRVTCTFGFEAAHRLDWHPGRCRTPKPQNPVMK